MTPDDHRASRERLGALALGQLSPEERAAIEAHLEGCAECRAEAEALAPMAAMLRRADPERLSPAPAPPPYLGDRSARRRRRARIGLGLGAAAAATAAVILAIVLTGSSNERPAGQTVAFHGLP